MFIGSNRLAGEVGPIRSVFQKIWLHTAITLTKATAPFSLKLKNLLIFMFKVRVLTYKKIIIIPPKKIKMIAKDTHLEIT